ncbi:MAG: GNAT family N-acetyltransferase [Acetatifactor sp.]|nr:GNAT family N-acetyltransferase [Acetatifactor sp.]
MITEDKWFTLKDGRKALLRNPLDEDIEGVLEYLRVSAAETDFILRYPEECEKYTYEGEKKLFDEWKESDCDFTLVCLVDGKVAGNCQLRMNNRMKTRHRASIGIALMKEYWNLGIGTQMFEEMIKVAKTKPEITQLELEFIEGNSRARALYEKMGFRIVATHPNFIKLKNGKLLNEYLMVKEL